MIYPLMLILVVCFTNCTQRPPLAEESTQSQEDSLPKRRRAASLSGPIDQNFLMDQFGTCELRHLTPMGFIRYIKRPELLEAFHKMQWEPADLLQIARDLGRSKSSLGDERGSFKAQMLGASSFQAAGIYYTLFKHMENNNLKQLNSAEIKAWAWKAHLEQYQRQFPADPRLSSSLKSSYQKMPNCGLIKWFNKKPDIFLAPVSKEARATIAKLFASKSLVRDFRINGKPFTVSEIQNFTASQKLNQGAIYELRALRLASQFYERQFAITFNDIGGWDGNKPDEGFKFVCTDEATTQYSFIKEYLQDTGLLKHFRLSDDGVYAYRKPKIKKESPLYETFLNILNENVVGISDHFGVKLSYKLGEIFVLDSWVEHGCLPISHATKNGWQKQSTKMSPLWAANFWTSI